LTEFKTVGGRGCSGSIGERRVPKNIARNKMWTRPEIKRLGVIKDVAGPGPIGPQGAHNKS
jgi:hypothetical protein